MKKLLIVLVVALMPITVFADTKENIKYLSNRVYVLEKELLNPNHDNNKSLEDIKYIRSISSELINVLSREYRTTKDLDKKQI